jgi:hypothetical protein
MKNNLKYPLYLFIIILVAKVGYVVVESFYNFHVLTITTGASLEKDVIEELNKNGHRISAVGITLLVLPFLYLLVKRFSKIIMIGSLLVMSIVTYFIAFEGLNIAIEKIVQNNKDKRHDAYYVNIFKYGVLNNIFAYNSFIDNKKIQNGYIDVNDRILLTNSFLLLHADQELISKLKERGKERVADLYIDRNLKEDYEEKFATFKKASIDISTLWNSLNSNKKSLQEELNKINNTDIQQHYKTFVSNLKESYFEYKNGYSKVTDKIKEETQDSKVTAIQKDLNKYFRYQSYSQAQKKYRTMMNTKFGYYIEPNRWKDSNNRVTKKQIKYVISTEIKKKSFGDSPIGLSVKEFMYHDETKLKVMQELKDKDILIPYDFDYSSSQFEKYFKNMLTKKNNEAYKIFYDKLKEEIGKNDQKLNMTWKEFIYSDYIKTQISENIQNGNIANLLEAIYSKDLSNFRKLAYLPSVIDEVNKMMYKEEDFVDGGKAELHGDDAIKLLYIPPFALSVSIIALLLNILTVIVMLVSLSNVSGKVLNSVRVGFILIILAVPFLSSYDSFENDLIKKSTTGNTQTYLEFLSWISYYEKLNSEVHN